jgi:hypothetical protein
MSAWWLPGAFLYDQNLLLADQPVPARTNAVGHV